MAGESEAAPPKVAPVIVIRKRKADHAGHHGGAWKVAYADFVTAMMSLFIVLWLMNSSEQVKKAVAGYFNDPRGTANLMGTTMSGTGAATEVKSEGLEALKAKLEQENGVRANQVTQVRGYADQMLRTPASPFDAGNRRISILVKNEAGTAAKVAGGNRLKVTGEPGPVSEGEKK